MPTSWPVNVSPGQRLAHFHLRLRRHGAGQHFLGIPKKDDQLDLRRFFGAFGCQCLSMVWAWLFGSSGGPEVRGVGVRTVGDLVYCKRRGLVDASSWRELYGVFIYVPSAAGVEGCTLGGHGSSEMTMDQKCRLKGNSANIGPTFHPKFWSQQYTKDLLPPMRVRVPAEGWCPGRLQTSAGQNGGPFPHQKTRGRKHARLQLNLMLHHFAAPLLGY